MKKILSNRLFIFIISGVFFASVTLYAANIYYANEVKYTPSDSSWNVTNVNDALNNLYSMKTELDTIKGIGDATAGDIASGKTAVVKGEKVTGTSTSEGWKIYEFNNLRAMHATSDSGKVEFSDSKWVAAAYQKVSKSDGSSVVDVPFALILSKYNFEVDFSDVAGGYVCLTVNNDTVSETNTPHTMRIRVGYAQSSTTLQYWYLDELCTSIVPNDGNSSNFKTGHFLNSNSTATSRTDTMIKAFVTSSSTLYFEVRNERLPNSSGSYSIGTFNNVLEIKGKDFRLSGRIIYK